MTDPFDSFVTDPANQAAVAAARAVAEANRPLYGPLVLVGPGGAGKSHLLEAIRRSVEQQGRPGRVELVGIEALAEALSAAGGPPADALRGRLVGAELLLLDDFDAVTRHPQLQGLLHEVLEARQGVEREVVIASARHPAELPEVDSRLVRRVEQGTLVPLGTPGLEARRRLLARLVEQSSVTLSPPVLDAVARLPLGSIREYLGAVNRLLSFQEVSSDPLDPEDALVLIGVAAAENGRETAPGAGAVAAVAADPAVPAVSPDDEFGAFLSEVTASVALQLDEWRERLATAIRTWHEAGVPTRRLEQALAGDLAADPEPLLAEFERDVRELRRIAAETAALAPDLAGTEALSDPGQLAAARGLLEQARARRGPLAAPLPDLRLQDLGVGTSNRLALQAAAAVVVEPGRKYNPLVLAGASGLGKTHILHGVGNALILRGVGPLACLSGHSFLAEVAALTTPDQLAAWRTKYHWVGALLLDDLHLLANEPRAQEELLLLFGELLDGGRQLVFSCGQRLSDLEGFDPRLLTRLQAGMVVDLLPPDREVRLAVVKGLLARTPAATDAALVDYLAGRPADSVRAVQGTVQRVLGEAEAQRVSPSPAFAREVLEVVESKIARSPRRPPGPASGIVSPGLGAVRSREKMTEAWPDVADRLISELR